MTEEDIYITISHEESEDVTVADLVYRGTQWASLSVEGEEELLTLYPADGVVLPVRVALASLDEARDRLRRLRGHS
jgi:hypothetical protein